MFWAPKRQAVVFFVSLKILKRGQLAFFKVEESAWRRGEGNTSYLAGRKGACNEKETIFALDLSPSRFVCLITPFFVGSNKTLKKVISLSHLNTTVNIQASAASRENSNRGQLLVLERKAA